MLLHAIVAGTTDITTWTEQSILTRLVSAVCPHINRLLIHQSTYIIRNLSHKIVRFQATQRSDGSIDLALDGEDLAESEVKALLDELAKTLGKTEVRLLPASAIKRTKRGKYRVFKSELN